jgi:hypothetical protein
MTCDIQFETQTSENITTLIVRQGCHECRARGQACRAVSHGPFFSDSRLTLSSREVSERFKIHLLVLQQWADVYLRAVARTGASAIQEYNALQLAQRRFSVACWPGISSTSGHVER